MSKLAYLQKRRLVQKEPLTVAMVAAMEAYVCDKRQPARERYVIGCFLICTFMRARFSDMMNLVDFTADSIVFGDLPGGYVEAKVTRTKSAYTLERKTMYLPMTAPRCGVSGLDWYEGWQHAKLVAAVPHGPGMPLFPALTNQGWSRVPATAGAAADWLRKNFADHGLSWCKGAVHRHTLVQGNNLVMDVEVWRDPGNKVSAGVPYYPKLRSDL